MQEKQSLLIHIILTHLYSDSSLNTLTVNDNNFTLTISIPKPNSKLMEKECFSLMIENLGENLEFISIMIKIKKD